MEDRTVICWDKDDIDTLGILKVDILALGMLSCIRKAFDLLKKHHAMRYSLATLPPEDPEVYDMLCEADSLGVFQVESRAQMNFLPRMKPRSFYDLVIQVAIIRPGPIQGDMVHPYLRRRNGVEVVTFPSDDLGRVLGKTLGRAAVSGTGDADRHHRGGVHADRGGPAAAVAGDVQETWLASASFMTGSWRGCCAKGYHGGVCGAVFRADRGVRVLWVSREPCGQLCLAGLCLGLDQAAPSGDLCLRAAEQPADGVLCARPRSCAMRASMGWWCCRPSSMTASGTM